jgi:hypothetical protein
MKLCSAAAHYKTPEKKETNKQPVAREKRAKAGRATWARLLDAKNFAHFPEHTRSQFLTLRCV